MADNSKEIKSLIKLRQQRPSFSRMISWEISQCENPQPVKKSKKKKQDSTVPNNETCDDDNEDNATADSDSSEYETATEDTDADADPNTGTMSNSESFNFEDLCIKADEIDGDNVDDDEDDDDDEYDDDELMMSCKSGSSVTGDASVVHHQERRRRPSKKQKRKRKLNFRVTYLDELYHLGNLHDPVDNIDDVFTEVSESGIDVAVQVRVPTLVELCLIASRRRHRTNSTKRKTSQNQTELIPCEGGQNQQIDPNSNQPALKLTLPVGLKKILAGRHQGKSEVQNQLSFFLNKVLPVFEKSLIDNGFYIDSMKYNRDNTSIFCPGVNSVWNELPYPWRTDSNILYGSEKGTAFLFSPSMRRSPYEDPQQYSYDYSNAYYCLRPVSISAMSALANTIDLMLPNEVNTTAIIRVKRALRLRYKLLVDLHFEDVFPYVLWSRGLVSKAAECFKTLIEKSKEYTVKSMYLSEIAKMHAMFGDTKTAVQFYRLASETASEIKGGNQEKAVKEITEQENILLASVHDIGVLDKEKSYQSNSYWSYILSRTDARTESIMAGVDAYLCYHLYYWNESKMYDEVIQKLEKLVKTYDSFKYHLSMLYALQGREDVSTKLYKQCRFGYLGAPADLILSYMGNKARNPWQPVLDHANKQKSAISPLKVIWRTNLHSPRLIQQQSRSTEGQFSSENLDLRLNEMGHLTGNLQMLLPPIRNVALDPFTGSVIVDRYSNAGMWTNAHFDPKLYQSENLMVPTPMLIYAGDNGTTVELVNPTVCMQSKSFRKNCSYKWEIIPPCPLMLYWRDCNGQVAKLNVFNEVKNHIKENAIHYLKNNEAKFTGNLALLKDEYELLFQMVDKAAEKNLTMTSATFDQTARNIVRERKRVIKKEKKYCEKSLKRDKKNRKKTIMRHYAPVDSSQGITVQLGCEPLVFGHTVLLHLRIEGGDNQSMFMFVNTSDKNAFVQPHLIEMKSGDKILYDCVRNNHSDEDFVILATDTRHLNIYNQTGVMVDSFEHKVVVGPNNEILDFLIIDQFLYGITKQRNGIWKMLAGCDESSGFYAENFIQWSIESILELWQELVHDSNNPPELLKMNYIGKNFGEGIGKLLMLNLGAGLAFIDPQTMEFVPVNVPDIYSKHYEFTSNGLLLKGKFETSKILAEKNYISGNSLSTLTVIGVQHKLFVLETIHEVGDKTVRLSMVYSLILPGVAKDVCFVGKQVGMLISLTQQTDDDQRYREHVFQYDWNGKLCGVLPCLHAGPRSFFVQYFHDNQDTDTETDTSSLTGWHAYMRDGRDGILCVQLNQ